MSARGYFSYAVAGALVSALLVGSALYLRSEDRAFRSTAVRAEAVVVAHQDRRWRDSSDQEHDDESDVYELTTATGQLVRFRSPVTATQPRREVGARAVALYAPGDASGARLDDDSRQTMARVFLWGSPLGVVFSAVFLFAWLRSRRPEGRSFEPSR